MQFSQQLISQCWKTSSYLPMLENIILSPNAGKHRLISQCWKTSSYLPMLENIILSPNAGKHRLISQCWKTSSYLPMLENIIYCKLQSTCYTLQSPNATCNDFKKVIRIVEKSRTEFWNWCYKLQFFLQFFLQLFLQLFLRCWKRKSIASYSRHVTRCNLKQELPKFQKKSLQPLKK